jgi:hypothetical protein
LIHLLQGLIVLFIPEYVERKKLNAGVSSNFQPPAASHWHLRRLVQSDHQRSLEHCGGADPLEEGARALAPFSPVLAHARLLVSPF